MARVLLNIDLGELPGEPATLYECAHVANVACGGHAGDDESMRRAATLCKSHGTSLGAHPSYPDREGFGRRRMAIPLDQLSASVAEQCARLVAAAGDLAGVVAFVKPHGALYHAAAEDRALADALVDGASRTLGGPITFIGPPRGVLEAAVARAGFAYWREGFADRVTRGDGTLVPRNEPGALVTDPEAAAAQARRLALGGQVMTVCVHGDTPGAPVIARAVRSALDGLVES